jgi:hypothetical protein
VKIILGDMNAKIGTEEMYKPAIGQESIHKESNNNGERLIDFAVSRNMIVSITYYPHKIIHKMTWGSPDGTTFNQIDHILIDRRHGSDVKDRRSCRGAELEIEKKGIKENSDGNTVEKKLAKLQRDNTKKC